MSGPVPAPREPRLAGQKVVLIGGSAGIGLETARLARAEGADVIQPFPSFSGIYDGALMALRMRVADLPPARQPMAAQAAGLRP